MFGTDTIGSFREEYAFLSNFYPAKVPIHGIVWPSAEHAYQAGKASTVEQIEELTTGVTSGKAKRMGKQWLAEMSPSAKDQWMQNRIGHMIDVIEAKFAPGTEMAEKLLSTGDATLIEGNTWGDTFWGVCEGRGENWLGRLLESQRNFLSKTKLEKA